MVLSIAVVGCSSDKSYIPVPGIAMPGGETHTKIQFPEDLEMPETSTAKLYIQEVDIKERNRQVSEIMAVDIEQVEMTEMPGSPDMIQSYTKYELDKGRFTVENEIGYWTYDCDIDDLDFQQLFDDPDLIYDFPSDDELTKKAVEYARALRLYDGEFSNVIIVDNTTEVWGKERVYEKDVYMYPSIDGYNVYGIFRIILKFNSLGEVKSVYKLANELGVHSDIKLKSREAVLKTLEAGEFSPSYSEELNDTVITSCHLAYYSDAIIDKKTRKSYVYPIYVLIGQGTNEYGEIQKFDIFIDAIDRE